MQKIVNHFYEMHPLGWMAIIGTILFTVGGIAKFATTAPGLLMWIGACLLVISVVSFMKEV